MDSITDSQEVQIQMQQASPSEVVSKMLASIDLEKADSAQKTDYLQSVTRSTDQPTPWAYTHD
jgi:hypothetical protein